MLNDTQCRNAKPKDKPYKLRDSNGLYLEIKPNGVKAWRYRFELREDGKIKESVFAIGDYANEPGTEVPPVPVPMRALAPEEELIQVFGGVRTEVYSTSPTGIRHIERLTGTPLAPAVIASIQGHSRPLLSK